MPRIFVSYARDDREVAADLAHALEAAGHEVWWDRALVAGQDYTAVIEQQLNDADAVVVLWSATSVKSKFVRDEANHALQSERLTPVRIEPVALPLGFASLHTADVFSQDEDANTVLEPAVLVDVVERRLSAVVSRSGKRETPHDLPRPVPAPRRRVVSPWVWSGGAAALAVVGTAATLSWMDRPEPPVAGVGPATAALAVQRATNVNRAVLAPAASAVKP